MHLEHFTPSEFGQSWPLMSPRLLTMLDILRYRIGSAVIISPHPLALARHNGPSSRSAHNVDWLGECMAADFFVSGVYHRAQAENCVHEMQVIGFTGIGVYTDTTYNGSHQVMFHGDVRPTEKMGDPAMWGRVFGKRTTLMAALQTLER